MKIGEIPMVDEEISYTMDDTIDIVVKEYEKEKNIKSKESR